MSDDDIIDTVAAQAICDRPAPAILKAPHSVKCPARCVRHLGHPGEHMCACQGGGIVNVYSDMLTDIADAAQGALKTAIRMAKNRYCDCPLNPYHRWNCTLTPVWAQTIRDLDVNPWTVMPVPDLIHDHVYGGDE